MSRDATVDDVLAGRAKWCVIVGDSAEVLPRIPAASVNAVVTDPPAGIGFMGLAFDHHTGGRAQWVAWETANGPIPDGLQVLHHCDNPPCVNPAHLFLGTNADNVADMIAKGRDYHGDPSGERNPNAKLTATQVAEVRARMAAGEPRKSIRAAFGVSKSAIAHIATGYTWRGPMPTNDPAEADLPISKRTRKAPPCAT